MTTAAEKAEYWIAQDSAFVAEYDEYLDLISAFRTAGDDRTASRFLRYVEAATANHQMVVDLLFPRNVKCQHHDEQPDYWRCDVCVEIAARMDMAHAVRQAA